ALEADQAPAGLAGTANDKDVIMLRRILDYLGRLIDLPGHLKQMRDARHGLTKLPPASGVC
ncbi:MAG: hypothetical protein ACHRHE_12160, partial [Tepidisphaerales bacterium]